MATIVMESAKVIKAAELVIEKIMARRNKEDNETIQMVIACQPNFSWKKGFYKKTHEEARQWLGEQGSFSRWGHSYYAWGDLSKAKALLHLAKHGDPVTLNEDDCMVLF